MRSDATIPASSTPPTTARRRATPSGMCTLPVKKVTFTDWLFWMMKTSRNTSTTTPTITPTQTPEIRVRPVGLPGAGVVRSGSFGTSAGWGVDAPSDAGDSSLMTSLSRSGLNQESRCAASLALSIASPTLCSTFSTASSSLSLVWPTFSLASPAWRSVLPSASRSLLSSHGGSPFFIGGVASPTSADDSHVPLCRRSTDLARGVGPCQPLVQPSQGDTLRSR